MIKHSNILRDGLYNLSPDSGSDTQYNRGIVLGIVSVLMAEGKSFEESINVVKKHLPKNFHYSQVPPAWAEYF
jgi:hypothetical protein